MSSAYTLTFKTYRANRIESQTRSLAEYRSILKFEDVTQTVLTLNKIMELLEEIESGVKFFDQDDAWVLKIATVARQNKAKMADYVVELIRVVHRYMVRLCNYIKNTQSIPDTKLVFSEPPGFDLQDPSSVDGFIRPPPNREAQKLFNGEMEQLFLALDGLKLELHDLGFVARSLCASFQPE